MALLRIARDTVDADLAAVCSKSAAVLLAAALERYINSVLEHACTQVSQHSWDDLTPGLKKFLCIQIARQLRSRTDRAESTQHSERFERRLREAVDRAAEAFRDPSSWQYFTEFGMFMDAAAEPERINATLKEFHPGSKSLFDVLEENGEDRAMVGRSLTDLIDARHAVAHAIPDRNPPGPGDVLGWIRVTFRLVRSIEDYLEV